MTTKTDLFGRVAEQSIEPLELWQWGLLIFFALALVAFSVAILAIAFSGNYGKGSWATSVFIGLVLYALLLPMYRAISPGTNNHWWLLTGSILAIGAISFFALLQKRQSPNPLYSLGVPVGAVALATFVDKLSEQLAGIPLAWPSAIFIVVFGVVAVLVMASDQGR